jgi:hypothetical protein
MGKEILFVYFRENEIGEDGGPLSFLGLEGCDVGTDALLDLWRRYPLQAVSLVSCESLGHRGAGVSAEEGLGRTPGLEERKRHDEGQAKYCIRTCVYKTSKTMSLRR